MVRRLLRSVAMKVIGRVTKRGADFHVDVEITDDGETAELELVPDEASRSDPIERPAPGERRRRDRLPGR